MFDGFDKKDNDIIDMEEFLEGLGKSDSFIAIGVKGNIDEQARFIFKIYDFHEDGFVHKEDIVTIVSE